MCKVFSSIQYSPLSLALVVVRAGGAPLHLVLLHLQTDPETYFNISFSQKRKYLLRRKWNPFKLSQQKYVHYYVHIRAVNEPSRTFIVSGMEKAPSRASSLLKALTRGFTKNNYECVRYLC